MNPKNQLRLVTSLRRDYYQIPISPDDQAAGTIQVDGQHEADAFVNFPWVHTFTPKVLLTVSPFYHFNSANYSSAPYDFPVATTDDRGSNYAGGQATLGITAAHNDIQVGGYGFWQHDNQLFGLLINDGSSPNFQDREIVSGGLESFFVEDKFTVTSWLTLSGGVRQTHFTSGVDGSENAAEFADGRIASHAPACSLGIARVLRPVLPGSSAAHRLRAFAAIREWAKSRIYSAARRARHGSSVRHCPSLIKPWALDLDTFQARAPIIPSDHKQRGKLQYLFPAHGSHQGSDSRLGTDAAHSADRLHELGRSLGTPRLSEPGRTGARGDHRRPYGFFSGLRLLSSRSRPAEYAECGL